MGRILRASALLGFAPAVVWAAEHVTIDNYLRAESDSYMGKCVQKGALGKFVHQREVTKVDPSAESAPKHGQDVIRMSRDTLYSSLILDLASPATLTFPDVGDRFLSLEFGSETHDIFQSEYTPGKHLLTRNGCSCEPPCRSMRSGIACTAFGTPYAFILLRTLANADNATDIAEAHKAQDSFALEQQDVGKWAVPDWSHADLVAVREHLLELKATSTEPVTFGSFTGPEKIDRLYGVLNVAAGWGGARAEDQSYYSWRPPAGDIGTFTLTMPKVPLDGNGFWSITVYNKEGYMFADPSNYNSAAQGQQGLNPDGSTTVHFGGCDHPARRVPSKAHCMPVTPGWNIIMRFFRPGKEILDGSWVVPNPVADAVISATVSI